MADDSAAERPQPQHTTTTTEILLRQLLAQGEAIQKTTTVLQQRLQRPGSRRAETPKSRVPLGVAINPQRSVFAPPSPARCDFAGNDKTFRVLDYAGRQWHTAFTQPGPGDRNRRKAQLEELVFMNSLAFYTEPVVEALKSLVSDLKKKKLEAADAKQAVKLGAIIARLTDVLVSLEAIAKAVVARTLHLQHNALQQSSVAAAENV